MIIKGIVRGVALAVLFISISSPSGAAAKKKAAVTSSSAKTAPAKTASSDAVSIPIPKTASRARSYFSSINPRILNLMEDGSPRSLKVAASLMHRSAAENYSECEKVLLSDCARIMRVAWPSSTVSWDTFTVSSTDAYTNALDNVERGIYDAGASGAVNEDFLTLVLPCLVLLKDKKSTDSFSKIESALKKALEIRGDSMLANYLMGILKTRQRKYADAQTYLENALAADGSCREVLLAQELVYSRRSDYKSMLALGEQLFASYPQDIEVIKYCCDAYYGLRNLDKAEEFAAKVLMIEPENFDYVLLRAKIFMAKADYVKSSSLLDAYVRGGGTSRDYFLLRAKLQKEWNKNNTAAAETMGHALTLYPSDKRVLLYAAQIASEANMTVGEHTALALAEKVLKKDAANADAIRVCIAEKMKSSDYEGAYSLSSEVIKAEGVSAEAVRTHIDICLALRRAEEAGKLAKELYAKNPSDAETQKTYLKVLVAQGRTSDASKMISQLMVSADSKMRSFLYYQQSFLYGDETSVLDNLRQSLTANPRNRDALYRLYQVYYNRKDWRRAQYYLKQVVALNPVDTNAIAKNAELDRLIEK